VSERGDQWEDRDQEEQEAASRARGPTSAEATVARATPTGGIVNQAAAPTAPATRGNQSKTSPVPPRTPRQIDPDPVEGNPDNVGLTIRTD
jgi:hypothetical protein